VQECVGFIDTVPHPAPASGQARLRQSSVRQMVAGTLFARRLHPRHDPRRPQAPGTPRRRRIENRPRRVAADF
jgi:hypothetical protein